MEVLRFVVFDLPFRASSVFEHRQREILQLVPAHHPFLISQKRAMRRGEERRGEERRGEESGEGKMRGEARDLEFLIDNTIHLYTPCTLRR